MKSQKTAKADKYSRIIFCCEMRLRTRDVEQFGVDKEKFLSKYYRLLFEKGKNNGEVYSVYPILSKNGLKLINFFKKFLNEKEFEKTKLYERDFIAFTKKVKTKFSEHHWFRD